MMQVCRDSRSQRNEPIASSWHPLAPGDITELPRKYAGYVFAFDNAVTWALSQIQARLVACRVEWTNAPTIM